MIILTTHPPQITLGNVLINVIFWAAVIALYRSRNKTTQNKNMWRGVQIFFAVLLVTLGANYAKKSIKDWWSK
jgi:hypothetical protein